MSSDGRTGHDSESQRFQTAESDHEQATTGSVSRRGFIAGGAGLASAALAPAALARAGNGHMDARLTASAHRSRRGKFPPALSDEGYFFVGGNYVTEASGQIMAGQMYVSYKIPRHQTHPPLVMIHGGGQTGTNFQGTPDGREGWADYMVAHGYPVYVVDQPARGRSAYHLAVDGPTNSSTAETTEQRFTAVQDFNLWPQAHFHTQWPDGGRIGDPVFDQFYASQVETVSNPVLEEQLNRAAGAALLDRIGPAVVLTHSQSGPFGWVIADARPNLVLGVFALEPSGPAFHDITFTGPPNYFADGPLSRPFGITATQITYDPPVTDPSQFTIVREATPDAPDLVRCWLQGSPVHTLPLLAQIPVVMLTSQASYHASYDHCTSKYLTQAGVDHIHVRMEDVGITGNGHMSMLELNNLDIAGLIDALIQRHILSAQSGPRRRSRHRRSSAAVAVR